MPSAFELFLFKGLWARPVEKWQFIRTHKLKHKIYSFIRLVKLYIYMQTNIYYVPYYPSRILYMETIHN